MADQEKNNLDSTVETLFRGLDGFLSTKTVVGEAVKAGDSILLPLSDVSFGLGAGAFSAKEKDNGGGGMGAKMSPSAVLQITKDGTVRVINLKNQDAVSKIIDLVPGIVSRFTNKGGSDVSDEDIRDAFHEEKE
ncbi:MAG: GerW family sporulation protein [Lachnospiraceae bacterium]|jgi:uncharacterized spore protein YtfJ|nr:GerW family sporulation protein [Lachnospiraceae bacterium]MCI1329269.1 GerW family sporulation protein [Lachnospiraceae bacterium]